MAKNASGVGRSHVELGLVGVEVSLASAVAASVRRGVMMMWKPWLDPLVRKSHFKHSGKM